MDYDISFRQFLFRCTKTSTGTSWTEPFDRGAWKYMRSGLVGQKNSRKRGLCSKDSCVPFGWAFAGSKNRPRWIASELLMIAFQYLQTRCTEINEIRMSR